MLTSSLRLVAGTLLSSLMLVAANPGGAVAEQARPPFPVIESPAPRWAGGQYAINLLGGNLPAIAEWYGKTADALGQELLRDPNLRIDEQGRLFATGRAQPGRIPPPPVGFARPVIDGAFDLHSKSGAPKAIVLDFQGADVTNSRWNKTPGGAINAPAFDTDGQPGFSQQELWDITTIWQRVAEDFAPFDVDVTTARPGPEMNANSIRVIVTTAIPSMCNKGSACGFLAYVDSFGSGEPAFVFAKSLNHGNEKSVAEAISHVVGRTLGLGADGVKDGAARYGGQAAKGKGWAPIMGNGSFQETTVFDNGSYAGASNTEDDFAVMQRHLALRSDNAGNTVAAATPLAAEALGDGRMRSSLHGVIERPFDFDVYSFTANHGMITATIAPAPNGPNAEMYLMLLNPAGVPVQITSTANGQPAAISYAATSGTYFLRVLGSGKLDAPDYGALGTYSVDVEYQGIANQPPTAHFTLSSASGPAPLSVSFDASPSKDDGTILKYQWNFEAGMATGGPVGAPQPFSEEKAPAWIYNTPGTYTAVLRVQDEQGQWSDWTSKTIEVTAPADKAPVAAFTADLTSGPATLSVRFDASASSDDGKIVKYSWDFGDGSAEGLLRHYGQDIKNQDTPIIGHYFFKPGTYDVTLTVTDDKGQVSSPARQTITVTVPNKPPVANYFSSQVRMGARHTFDFDASSSTDDVGIVSYRWEWGDGSAPTVTTEPAVSHVFPSGGSFDVYMTVTDAEGRWSSLAKRVYVPRGMQPSIEVFDHASWYGPEIVVRPMLNGGYTADSLIFVRDGQYNLLAGAEVRWTLEGSETASGTAISNERGTARIDLPLPKSRAEYGALCLKLTIESVSKPGWHYEPVNKPVRTYCPPTVIADRPVIQVTGTNGAAVATATVTVRDNHGNPAPGVLVTGQWPGQEPNASATTDSSGVATFQVSSAGQSCFGFMLGAISKPGFASAETRIGIAMECLPGTEPEVTIQ